jgi:hypothetical protein
MHLARRRKWQQGCSSTLMPKPRQCQSATDKDARSCVDQYYSILTFTYRLLAICCQRAIAGQACLLRPRLARDGSCQRPNAVINTPETDVKAEKMPLSSVCVFCGSSSGHNPVYMKAAKRLGEEIAARNMKLVYGGALFLSNPHCGHCERPHLPGSRVLSPARDSLQRPTIQWPIAKDAFGCL